MRAEKRILFEDHSGHDAAEAPQVDGIIILFQSDEQFWCPLVPEKVIGFVSKFVMKNKVEF